MVKSILENRFALLWATLFVSLLGVFAYERMEVELLPASSESKFLVILQNPGSEAESFGRQFEPLVRRAIHRLEVNGDLRIEAHDERLIAFYSPHGHKKDLQKDLETVLEQELTSAGIQSTAQVLELSSAHGAVMTLMVRAADGASVSTAELRNVVETGAVRRLLQIEGVADVKVTGLSRESLELLPKVEGHADRKVSPTIALGAVASVLAPPKTWSLPGNSSLVFDFQQKEKLPLAAALLPLGKDGNISQLTTISDLFVVTQAPAAHDVALHDGKSVVLLSVFRQAHATDIDVSNAVRSWSAEFQRNQKDLEIQVVSDVADYIRAAEENVVNNLRDGTLLTCICVWVFVRSLRKTTLIALSIPISVLTAFPILYLAGLSRNLMSLAGIALAVGIVVDAALSVVQDLFDNLEKGFQPSEAALRAARENFAPIGLTALTTLAVFVPILWLDGVVGTLFYDLSLTFIIAQCTSFVAAVFVTPALGAFFFETLPIRFKTQMVDTSKKNSTGLDKFLFRFFGSPIVYWGLSLVFILLVIWSFTIAPAQEFLPKAKTTEYRVSVHVGEGLSDVRAEELAGRVDGFLKDRTFTNRLGARDSGYIRMDFKATEHQNLGLLETELSKVTAPYVPLVTEINPLDPRATDGKDVEFYIESEHPGRHLLKTSIESIPAVVGQVWSDESKRSVLQIDKLDTSSKSYLIPSSLLSEYWKLSRMSFPIGRDGVSGSFAPVVFDPLDQSLILNPFVGTVDENSFLRLSSATSFVPDRSFYVNGKRMEKVEVAVRGKTATEIAGEIKKLADDYGITVQWDEGIRDSEKSIQSLEKCILIALLLTILILYAQNRSIVATIITMFTFIWGPVGSFPGLVMHHETLNGSALVGFILLAGTIVNNGILVMDLVAKYRRRQFTPIQCCVMAVKERSLNVVITSLTTVFGMLPMVFETGAGSQMYRGLSIVVVYGTLISTPISLVGIPCLVMIAQDVREFFERTKLRLSILAFSEREKTGARI